MIDFPASPTIGQTFIDPTTNLEWMWDGTKWVASGIAGGPFVPQAGFVPAMNDNRIINGDMRIDQRNNGASGTANGYSIDRWIYSSNQVGKISWQRGTPNSNASNFQYYMFFNVISAYTPLAGDTFALGQNIEADMVGDFNFGASFAQPVTLSFWVNSTLIGTFSGSIRNTDVTRSYPFTFSIPTANVWTKIIITIPGDTAGTWVLNGNGAGLNVNFDLGCGATLRGPANAWASANYAGVTGTATLVASAGATFALTGVKLEVGSVATPFNRQSLAKSLADCQRYYQVLAGLLVNGFSSQAATLVYSNTALLVQMRSTPSVVYSATGYGNASGLSINSVTAACLASQITLTSPGGGWALGTAALSAEL
jgi:hypothetical protein